MYARRTVAAAIAVVALLAGSAGADTNGSLNGTSRRSMTYSGAMNASTLTTPGQGRTVVDTAAEPVPSDCSKDSCDISRLRLTVPRGRQSGRFDYVASLQESTTGFPNASAYATASLYDSKGRQLLTTGPCCSFGYLRLSHPVLAAGTYTVIIYNHGHPTSFEATVQWVANPPHRSR